MVWKGILSVGMLMVGCALFVAQGFAGEKGDHDMAVAKVGAPAPAFSLQDQDGKTVSLSDYAGKIVVLEWWNNECPVVQRSYNTGVMPQTAKKYTEKGVVWLAVNSTAGKTNANNKQAAADMKIDRPVLNDSTGQVGHLYGATNTPGMFVIDKNGVLAYMGAIDDNATGRKTEGVKNYVAQAIDELLSGQSVSEPVTKQYGCTVHYAK